MANKPELLLYGMNTIGDVWYKMVWDIRQFERLIQTKPVDAVSLPLAYPNVCLSAMALRDWFKAEAQKRARAVNGEWSDATSLELIRAHIRWSQLAEDVANTFKHRGYRSSQFKSGIVDVRVSLPAPLDKQRAQLNELDAAMFALTHSDVANWTVLFRDHETGEEVDALQVFWAWEEDWHKLLSDLDMLQL